MLRLDVATAEVIRDHIYMVGEHFAGGSSVRRFSRADEARLAAVMCALDKAVGGRGCMACAMARRSVHTVEEPGVTVVADAARAHDGHHQPEA
ncbi:hypothetical protein D5H75_19180 [Bailinhaonella thermotolerans]|uniref:Uncharacterized protein n=1 Tax=Bailinhaonella thermotolerans TaxID=1070861 RepID=A0A3A4AU43_9ACTN|nr:hypothetical protein D5H75_19180 [Bailinhaonella thermotolerans]